MRGASGERHACLGLPRERGHESEWRESETESRGSVSENESATPNGLNGGRIPRFERVLFLRRVHLRPRPPDACSSSTLLVRCCDQGNELNEMMEIQKFVGGSLTECMIISWTSIASPGLPSPTFVFVVAAGRGSIPQSFAMLSRLLRPASNVFSQRAAMATIRNAKNPQV